MGEKSNLVEEAWSRLYSDREFFYIVSEEYNRRLGDYNANISLSGSKLVLKYNLNWKNVDMEIKIGLIQHLLVKMFRGRKNVGTSCGKISTFNIELYEDFCKRIPEIASATVDTSNNCELLKASFDRVNSNFFNGIVEEPKMTWGSDATRRLASYNYHTDTVNVSRVFSEASEEVLDLLMYHEVLHKVHGFKCIGGRTHTHTPEFKMAENLYPQKEEVEKRIESHVAYYKRKKRSEKKNKVREEKKTREEGEIVGDKFKQENQNVSESFSRNQDYEEMEQKKKGKSVFQKLLDFW